MNAIKQMRVHVKPAMAVMLSLIIMTACDRTPPADTAEEAGTSPTAVADAEAETPEISMISYKAISQRIKPQRRDRISCPLLAKF